MPTLRIHKPLKDRLTPGMRRRRVLKMANRFDKWHEYRHSQMERSNKEYERTNNETQ